MSYKLKSLLYLFSFIASSLIYQNYDNTRPDIDSDLDSSELARMDKEHDTTKSISQVGVVDFDK